MKYLPLLLLLVGCESFPEKRDKPEYVEMPVIDTHPEDGIKIAPYDDEERIDTVEVWKYIPVYNTVEIDVSFFTHRRYMVYIDIVRK